MIKATYNGSQIELSPDDVQLPEGYALITPDRVPDGYLRKEAFEAAIKDRLKNVKTNTADELKRDAGFRKQILSEYGITTDETGKPVGLVPEADLQRIKQEVAKSATSELSEKLESVQGRAKQLERGYIRSSILEWAAKNAKPEAVNGFGGEAYIVKLFEDRFALTDDNRVALKDDSGFAVNGNGYVTPEQFFTELAKKDPDFRTLLKDNRQQSGNGAKPGAGQTKLTKADLSDATARAKQFQVWREAGLRPIDEFNKLPDK